MHKIFTPSLKPQVFSLQVLVLDAIFCLLTCRTCEVSFVVVCRFFELLQATGLTVVLSTRNTRRRQDVGVIDNC